MGKRRIALILSAAGLGVLVLLGIPLLPRVVILGLIYLFGSLLVVCRSRKSEQPRPVATQPAWGYQPRPTDAGHWLDAPVAELDKSTIGKLLASRLRREPSLHVVIGPATPKAITDPLYDPELDG